MTLDGCRAGIRTSWIGLPSGSSRRTADAPQKADQMHPSRSRVIPSGRSVLPPSLVVDGGRGDVPRAAIVGVPRDAVRCAVGVEERSLVEREGHAVAAAHVMQNSHGLLPAFEAVEGSGGPRAVQRAGEDASRGVRGDVVEHLVRGQRHPEQELRLPLGRSRGVDPQAEHPAVGAEHEGILPREGEASHLQIPLPENPAWSRTSDRGPRSAARRCRSRTAAGGGGSTPGLPPGGRFLRRRWSRPSRKRQRRRRPSPPPTSMVEPEE